MNQFRPLIIGVCLSALYLLALSNRGAIAADADSLAKQIEPFMTPNTVVVAHVDLTRLEIAPLFATARQWTGMPKDRSAAEEQMLTTTLSGLRELGAKDAFLLVDPTDLPFQGPLLAIPVAARSDEKIAAILKPFGLDTVRRADILLAGKADQIDRQPVGNPPKTNLAKALAAGGDSVLRVAVLPSDDHRRVAEELLPRLPDEIGGGETKALTRGVEWLALGVNPPPKLKLVATVGATSPESAAKVNDIIKASLDALSKAPEVKKAIPNIGAMLKAATPKINGSQLTLVLNGDRREGPTLETFLQPAILQSRQAAMRAQSINNMKQLAIAMHMYLDTHKTFPPAYIAKDGKPLLSWRVLILPYIEQDELYKQFKLDEPWDSAHNRPLIKRMPKLYHSPASQVDGEGRTVYLAPRGDVTIFPGAEGVKIQDIRDGTSNTVMILEGSDDQAVEWTRPDDWKFSPDNQSAGLGGQFDGIFHAALADGSVRAIKLNTDKSILKALFTRNGGEVIPSF